MSMKLFLHLSVFIFGFLIVSGSMVNPSYAFFGGPTCPKSMKNDKDHCGLWLCIPGGMVIGCEKERKYLVKRLSKGCSPLPSYRACSSSGTGKASKPRMGFPPCKEGYELSVKEDNKGREIGRCRNGSDIYPNPKKRYIDVEVNGEKYPRFWY